MSSTSKEDKDFIKLRNLVIKYVPIMVLVYLSINILGLVLPLTMKNIYGSVISSKSVISLRVLMFGTLVALFFEAILRKVKDSTNKWISSIYEYKLTNTMIEKIFNSYTKENSKNYISDLEVFNSVSNLSGYYSGKVYQLLIDLPFMMLYLFLIFIIGRSLVAIPTVLIVFYMITTFIMTGVYSASREKELEESESILRILTETLEKIHIIKGAGIEAHQIKFYKNRLTETTKLNFLCNRVESAISVFKGNYGQITLFSILLGGGVLMNRGLMTFGEVTACAMLGSRSISPIIHVMDNYHQNKEMKLTKNRIEKLLSREKFYEEEVQDFPEDIEGTIEIIKLSYADVQSKAKSTISLTIPKGAFVTINPREFLSYGMILNKLYGKEKISEGKILIDNLDISKWNMSSLKGKMEFLQSNVNIVKGSVLDNIVFYDYTKAQNAYIAANLTGLDELVSQMPEGYETQLDSYYSNQLSAEFLQKLNLTRAFVDRPRILILDRLEESMDEETKKYYLWLLENLKGSMMLIVVTTNVEISMLKTHYIDKNGIFEEGAKYES